VPPLAQRPEDILPLARHFLERAARERGAPPPDLSPQAEQALRAHGWPGNVRELENRIRRAVLVGAKDRIGPDELDLTGGAALASHASPASRAAPKDRLPTSPPSGGSSKRRCCALTGWSHAPPRSWA